MEVLENRISSFSKPKRIKGSKKLLKWPHDDDFKAAPQGLAEAGFYYNPSLEDKDNVTCFMCNKDLSDWEAEDDPFDVHWEKCGQKCSWALVRCGLRNDMDRNDSYTFPDKTRIPTAKLMEKARLDTFDVGDGWLHDQDKNHGASSKKMAQAGFIFTPQHAGDDLVTCVYCTVSLGGWDRDDDPLEEHRKREKKTGKACPFVALLASPQASSAVENKKPPSRSSTKPPSRTSANPLTKSKSTRTLGHTRSASSHIDTFEPTKIHDGNTNHDGDDSDYFSTTSAGTSTAAVKKGAKTPRKPRGTSGAKTPGPRSQAKARSRSRGEDLGDVEEDLEEDGVEFESTITAAPKPKRKTKGRANAVVEEEEGPPAPVAKKHTRTRSKSVKRKPEAEVELEEEQPKASASKKPARTRSKSVSRKAPQEIPEDEDEEEPPKPKARGKGRPKAVEKIEETEEPKVQRGRRPTTHKKDPQYEETPADAGIVTQLDSPTEEDRSPDPMQIIEDEISSVAAAKPPRKKKLVSSPQTDEGVLPLDQPAQKPQNHMRDRLEDNQTSVAKKVPAKQPKASQDVSADRKMQNAGQDAAPVPPDVVQVSDDEMNIAGDVSMQDISDEPRAKSPSPVRRPSPNPLAQKSATTKRGPPQKKPVVEILRPSTKQNTVREEVTREPDVSMHIVEPQPQATQLEEMPVTPPRNPALNLPSLPQPQESLIQETQQQETADYPRPPLSLLPFTPIQSLTTAELDMTVEQWIRYQMGVEFDKFKRDGERELERFKQRAEEVRRMIEEL
ncbi:hypothetical protein BDN72DRAFT_428357 [Pluteus cervinus]|uniref:Uncharacterized protein n=1 Tax=Pluteus cervinus TaxID=181527 RepID=A0ACD3B1C0_9AGAR|nr:hypothetical protein BDN72DRAFT_428357 [Pluteus cervinus]